MNAFDLAALEGRFADLPTPAMVVDVAGTRRNIGQAVAELGDASAWRPHVKTARTALGIGLLMDAGVRRVKASTIGEAACAAEQGASDVLLAIPAGRVLRLRLAALAWRHPSTRFSTLIDDGDLEDWPSRVGAFVDLDVGMARTGVPVGDIERGAAIAGAIVKAGIRFGGFHAYDGHLADAGEHRRPAVEELFGRIEELVGYARAGSLDVAEVVMGSTHTLVETAGARLRSSMAEIITVGAGTVVYGDRRSRERFESDGLPFRPTAFVASRVVSVSGDRVTLDAGLTAAQTDAGRPHVVVVGWPDVEVVSASQEHLVVRDPRRSLARDRLVLLVPRHVDTALSQFEFVHYIDGSAITRSRVVGRH